MHRALFPLLALAVAGCSGKSLDPFVLADLGGACSTDTRAGGFQLSQWEDPTTPYATVSGEIASGVNPNTILFPRENAGDCQLLQKINPFCDPICQAGQTCSHDEECIPFPERVGLGKVDIIGLIEAMQLEPDATNNYWDTTVDYPLFTTGSLIGVETSDFLLRGIGVDALEAGQTTWNIARGQDLELTWTPSSGESQITLSFNVDQHGNSPVTMVCATEDTGSISVPSSLLDTLLDYGISGFATGTMRRQTADKVDLDQGCADLKVFSHVVAQLSVEGHTPCFNDTQCPEEQHCDVPINTCVDD